MSVNLTQHSTILHVINSLSLGGAEVLLSNTIRLLPEFKHIVVYLCPPEDFSAGFKGPNVELICLQQKGWKSMFFSIIKLNRIIREKKPVLVHSHLFNSTLCARLATPTIVPLLTTIHSEFSKDAFSKNKNSLIAARLTLKKRHSLIGVSNHVLKDYLSYVPFRGKCFVLHNFLPDSLFHNNLHSPPNGIIKLVAVGNLKEAKNYWYLLEICKYVKGVSLDIYGTGSLENELKEFISKEQLNIRLCGSTNAAPAIFKQYDYFIQASLHEGFGLSVIEAMAVGIPVLLSDIPVFREITNELATFFPLDDAAEAAEILTAAFNDKYPTTVANEAFTFVQDQYSAKRYKQKLLGIYEEVVQNLHNQ